MKVSWDDEFPVYRGKKYMFQTTNIYIYMYVCIYLFIYLFIYLSMYIFVYLSIYLSIYVYICLFIYLFIYLSMYIFVYLSIYLFIYLCIYIYIYRLSTILFDFSETFRPQFHRCIADAALPRFEHSAPEISGHSSGLLPSWSRWWTEAPCWSRWRASVWCPGEVEKRGKRWRNGWRNG